MHQRRQESRPSAVTAQNAPPGAATSMLVAASALRPPTARTGTVPRQALLEELAESLAARLVLIVAPAGWGKTSLLRDWWLAAQETGAGWLSLEERDNDPVHFWSAVIAALATVVPGVGAAAADALAADGAAPPGLVESMLVDGLARMPRGRVPLVLDDFHLVTNPDVLSGLAC